MERTVTEIKDNEALEYARYTVFNRVMPSMVDGMKPVQRFFLFSTFENAKNEYKKVSGVGGVVSEYGYAHGEISCQQAGQAMVASWNNNIPLIEGSGSFGTRMVREAAAPRYTKVKLASICEHIFKDTNLCPAHKDPEHVPPQHYVPIIPMALINGSSGIATGFKQEILPRDPINLINIMINELSNSDYGTTDINVKFPEFKGTVEKSGESEYGDIFTAYGSYTLERNNLTITEIPPGFDRIKYITLLDKLQDAKVIKSYIDESSDDFRYLIKLERDVLPKDEHEWILKTFKLSETFHESILVIDPEYNLRKFTRAIDLVDSFIKYRLGIYSMRIKNEQANAAFKLELLKATLSFSRMILDGTIDMRNHDRKSLSKEILRLLNINNDEIIKKLINIRIIDISTDSIDALINDIADAGKVFDYWYSTTESIQFIEDLKSLRKVLMK